MAWCKHRTCTVRRTQCSVCLISLVMSVECSRTMWWSWSAVDLTKIEADKEPLRGPSFFFSLKDLKWFQMLLGMTNRLRISTAASPTDAHYVIASTDQQSTKVPHFTQLKKSSWEADVLFWLILGEKKKSVFGAELETRDPFVSWKLHLSSEIIFWMRRCHVLKRVNLLKRKKNKIKVKNNDRKNCQQW